MHKDRPINNFNFITLEKYKTSVLSDMEKIMARSEIQIITHFVSLYLL